MPTCHSLLTAYRTGESMFTCIYAHMSYTWWQLPSHACEEGRDRRKRRQQDTIEDVHVIESKLKEKF